jgi:hypothetical protein
MDVGDIRAELLTVFTELYEDEPEENYDMESAVHYWRTACSREELENELMFARTRLEHWRASKL